MKGDNMFQMEDFKAVKEQMETLTAQGCMGKLAKW
jgi:hypothetical protein